MGFKDIFNKAKSIGSGYRAPDPAQVANDQRRRSTRADAGEQLEEVTPIIGSDAWIQEIDEADLMLEHLFEIAEGNDWFDIDEEEYNIQLMTIRSSVNTYVSRPLGDEQTALEVVARGLSCDGCMIMSTDATRRLIESTPPMAKSIILGGKVNKLVDNILPFPSYEVLQTSGICFIKEIQGAILWNDDASALIEYAQKWDEHITKLVFSEKSKLIDHTAFGTDADFQKDFVNIHEKTSEDEERALQGEERPAQLMWPLTVAMTFVIMGLLAGTIVKAVVIELIQSGSYLHLAYLVYIPLVCVLSAFFLSIIASGILQMVGPITHLQTNSKFYSAIPPTTTIARQDLPHISIHCPIYKEQLWSVVDPTIQSCRAALATYEAQGGTANIMVFDDGAQLRSPKEQKIREQYYAANRIGWVGRRPHKKDGYLREGLFKKASNLNHGINLSVEIEAEYERIQEGEGTAEEYETARQTVLEKRDNVDWCGGDLSIGNIVLIIDSDTRLPTDCLLSGVLEMRDSPDLGILQHTASALIISGDFWEHGMAHFIHMVFFGIRYCVAGGDMCPFLGHNAFLRWSVMEEVSVEKPNGDRHFWSEDHVSEDFELALRVQTAGFSTRLAIYGEKEFEEGVSITVYDEISRWTKYAWGCSELMFHPFKFWFKRGPFTPLIRQFLTSKRVPMAAKCSSLFYMWTYWIIGSTWIYTVINYFAYGWFYNELDRAYINQFGILVSICVVFGLHDLVVIPFAKYRLREVRLWEGITSSLKNFWIPIIFFMGTSIHVGKALFLHLLGRKMQWGSTAKTVTGRTLVEEAPIIWRKYRLMFFVCFGLIVLMLVFRFAVPKLYVIDSFVAVTPLAWMVGIHILNPFLLNAQSYLSELLSSL